MEGSVTLDHISTQLEYDLRQLCESDGSVDDLSYSPYELSNNTCQYYEPGNVNDALIDTYENILLIVE